MTQLRIPFKSNVNEMFKIQQEEYNKDLVEDNENFTLVQTRKQQQYK